LSAEDIRHADSTGKVRGGQTGWNPVLGYDMKSFWLVKQEPSSYSWSDFLADGETSWTGVRNFSARNNLRKMRTGDEVFFYHTGDEKSVIGIAKVIRTAYPDPTADGGGWVKLIVGHPEQPMFFVPFVLLTVLLALKVDAGLVTLAWGAEAASVYVLALWAKERTFRLAGLALMLVLCVPKLVWDVLHLDDPTARYLSLIGMGALMFAVSFLYSRNREALRQYL